MSPRRRVSQKHDAGGPFFSLQLTLIPRLPCKVLDETATIEILDEVAVGEDRGNGSQIFHLRGLGSVKGNVDNTEIMIGNVNDPLYYRFADEDFPNFPKDVMIAADGDFAEETAAYTHLDPVPVHLGGSLIITKVSGLVDL